MESLDQEINKFEFWSVAPRKNKDVLALAEKWASSDVCGNNQPCESGHMEHLICQTSNMSKQYVVKERAIKFVRRIFRI